jgi:acylphosphatase
VVEVSRAVRCLVAGHVQGVYFRAATAERAQELGVRGWVKNLPDRRVEVVATGNADAIATLTRWLWQGPPRAHVVGVTIEEWTGQTPDDFSVR